MAYFQRDMVLEQACSQGFEDVNRYLWTGLKDAQPVVLVSFWLPFSLELNFNLFAFLTPFSLKR